jgi:hypothetical protein
MLGYILFISHMLPNQSPKMGQFLVKPPNSFRPFEKEKSKVISIRIVIFFLYRLVKLEVLKVFAISNIELNYY